MLCVMTVMWVFCVIHVCRGVFFFVKQKTAYEMRISDWSSDVCSSDLVRMKFSVLVVEVPRCFCRIMRPVEWGLWKMRNRSESSMRCVYEISVPVAAPNGRTRQIWGCCRWRDSRSSCRKQIGRASFREGVCQYV